MIFFPFFIFEGDSINCCFGEFRVNFWVSASITKVSKLILRMWPGCVVSYLLLEGNELDKLDFICKKKYIFNQIYCKLIIRYLQINFLDFDFVRMIFKERWPRPVRIHFLAYLVKVLFPCMFTSQQFK